MGSRGRGVLRRPRSAARHRRRASAAVRHVPGPDRASPRRTGARSRLMGKVYLVGAGPGAADLLTVRATRLLARADVVFHDALVEQDVLDLAPAAILVAVGKRCGAHSTSQRFINKRLVDAASRYATVVRLKGGDPMLFGQIGRAHV